MKQRPATGERRPEGLRAAEIALHQLRIEALEVAPVAATPHQQAQPMATRDQRARDRRADEAGGAGDQCR